MGIAILSYDGLLQQSAVNGNWPIWWSPNTPAAVTAATTTSGYVSALRYTSPITMPASFGTGIQGAYLTDCRVGGNLAGTVNAVAIEYLLGTLTVSGNSYVNGVTMPMKTVRGVRLQTAAQYTVAVVTTAMTATTPVLTMNYTNQAGTSGRSCTLTLPTSPAINTAFVFNSALQSGDTGVQSLSASAPNGLSISTGSAGVIKLYGLLILSASGQGIAGSPNTPDPITVSEINYMIEANENIGFYRFGQAAAAISWVLLNLVPSD